MKLQRFAPACYRGGPHLNDVYLALSFVCHIAAHIRTIDSEWTFEGFWGTLTSMHFTFHLTITFQ